MRKKSGLTIVEQAVMLVHEFENVVRKLDQRVANCFFSNPITFQSTITIW